MPVQQTSPSSVPAPGALPATYPKGTPRSAQEAAPCYARFLTRHTVRYNARGYSRTELLKAEIASWLQVGLAFDGWDVRFNLLVTLAALSISPRLRA